MTEPLALVLVGRPDCHLCHEMRETLDRVVAGCPLSIVEKNVDQDEQLSSYQLAIPVLLFGSIEIARYSVSELELEARLRALGVLEAKLR